MMQTNVLPSIDALGLNEEAWNVLAAGSETNTVFQTYEWVSSWEKMFAEQCEPLLISVANSNGVVGIAPLMVKQGLFGERRVMFIGEGKADYCDFLTIGDRRKVLEAMCHGLFAARERWDVIELNNIPAESSTVRLVQDICRCSGYRVLQRELYQSPTLQISGREDEAVKILNKAGLRRRQNYFQRHGHLTYRTLSGTDILPCLDMFFKQHIGRWAGTATPSLFLDERNRLFYRELALAMSLKKWLALSIVELDGQPLAIHYGFHYNGRLLWYKPSFDRAHSKHSPGLVLLRYLIEYAIEQKLQEFDFTIGNEPFKSRFANNVRATIQLEIFRDPLRFAMAWSRRKLGLIKRRVVAA